MVIKIIVGSIITIIIAHRQSFYVSHLSVLYFSMFIAPWNRSLLAAPTPNMASQCQRVNKKQPLAAWSISASLSSFPCQIPTQTGPFSRASPPPGCSYRRTTSPTPMPSSSSWAFLSLSLSLSICLSLRRVNRGGSPVLQGRGHLLRPEARLRGVSSILMGYWNASVFSCRSNSN